MNVPEDYTTVVEISASIPSEVLYANVKRVILEAVFIAQVSICRNEKYFLAVILIVASLPLSYYLPAVNTVFRNIGLCQNHILLKF